MVVDKEYYNLLGVSTDAGTDEISKSYKKQALKCHPDKTNHDPQLTEKFKKLTKAYEVLRNPETRAIYDRYGESNIKNNTSHRQSKGFSEDFMFSSSKDFFGDVFHNLNNMFDNDSFFDSFGPLFSLKMSDMGFRIGSKKTFGFNLNVDQKNMKKHVKPLYIKKNNEFVKGPNVYHVCKVSLFDLFYGKTFTLQIIRNSKCTYCKGEGGLDVNMCFNCKGMGNVNTVFYNQYVKYEESGTCKVCDGKGKIISSSNVCKNCKDGYVKERKNLEVKILPGFRSDDKIILEGESDGGKNIIPGDIIITISQIPDSLLTRKDNDLYMSHEIDLKTALLGGHIYLKNFLNVNNTVKININLLNDKKINHGIGSTHKYDQTSINHGDVGIIKNLGMPINDLIKTTEIKHSSYRDMSDQVLFDLNRYERGDLYIKFNVKIPSARDFVNGILDLLKLNNILPSTKNQIPTSNDLHEYDLKKFLRKSNKVDFNNSNDESLKFSPKEKKKKKDSFFFNKG